MIGIGANTRIFLYRGSADMRKGFDGLSGIVRDELGVSRRDKVDKNEQIAGEDTPVERFARPEY